MRKKKLLFIISNMQTGGVSKSMTSLMNVIDRERYDVSLMITSPNGPFMELLPKDLRIISNPVWTALHNTTSGLKWLLENGKFLLAMGHCLRLMLSTFNKAWAARMIAMLMPSLTEKFDAVIDYNGQQQLYYMVNKLKADKKITFFHSDYAKWPYYYKADKKYFPKVDLIYTISPQCVASLKHFFPDQTKKIHLFQNISSLQLIEKMSTAEVTDFDNNVTTLLTVGHVCENKGILWAVEAASILKKAGISFKWYFIGTIDRPEVYKNLITSSDVEDRIVFLGTRINPYAYIRRADIIVHPSKFEGRSIALDEAKLLCKPVVVTNFSTVRDQFQDRHNASVCSMDAMSIAQAIEELIHNPSLRDCYAHTLLNERKDNSDEIEKLYSVFDQIN